MFESQEQHAVRGYLKTRQAIHELRSYVKEDGLLMGMECPCIECDGTPEEIEAWRDLVRQQLVFQNDLFTFSGWTWDDIAARHKKHPLKN